MTFNFLFYRYWVFRPQDAIRTSAQSADSH